MKTAAFVERARHRARSLTGVPQYIKLMVLAMLESVTLKHIEKYSVKLISCRTESAAALEKTFYTEGRDVRLFSKFLSIKALKNITNTDLVAAM